MRGDITTDATIAAGRTQATARSCARKPGVVAGSRSRRGRVQDARSRASSSRAWSSDGGQVAAGGVDRRVSGKARALLTGERTALNFLGHLSGIATLTARYVAAVAGTQAQITDTRKTTPGLRAFEKYAVRCGGGINHRFGLYRRRARSRTTTSSPPAASPQRSSGSRARVGHMVKIEVEVDTLAELDEALQLSDRRRSARQYGRHTLGRAVALVKGRVVTEASGGVSLETVGEIARPAST